MGPRDRAPPRCLFCDKPERVEIFEIWDHEMMFETCCEGMHEQIVSDINDGPRLGATVLAAPGCRGLVRARTASRHRRRRLRHDPGLAAGVTADRSRRGVGLHRPAPRALPRTSGLAFPHISLERPHAAGRGRRRQSSRTRFQRPWDGRGKPSLCSPGHRNRPALERRLHALWLVRPGGREQGLEQDHHIHADR